MGRNPEMKNKRVENPEFGGFHDYWASVKPRLDADFTSRLTAILGDDMPDVISRDNGIFTGGKRIRGSLLCLTTEALGGDVEEALQRATAIELIQTATLIHDDFVDQHETRRNSPTLWTLHGARKAVLLGDIIFASVICVMNELGRREGLVVSRAIAEVSRGAYHEMLPSSLLRESTTGIGGASFYERIIHLKTGVLFGAACELGAIAAGADHQGQERWRDYGLRIGEAYQIADDLLEIERHLSSRLIQTKDEMASLIPALLFFARDIRAALPESLPQGPFALDGKLVAYLDSASHAMRTEIDRRLRSAVSGLEGHIPDNGYGPLVRKTPGDIIGMFMSSGYSVG